MRNPLAGLMMALIVSSQLVYSSEIQGPSDHVRIVSDASQVAGCSFLGEVIGKSGWSEKRAFENLRKNAARLGANRVLFTVSAPSSGTKYRGEAYFCGSAEIKPEPTPIRAIEATGPKTSEEVRVVSDATQVAGCKFLDEVVGESSWSEKAAFENLKKNAEKLGGNRVLFTLSAPTSGTKYRGEVYFCDPIEAARSAAPTTSESTSQQPEK